MTEPEQEGEGADDRRGAGSHAGAGGDVPRHTPPLSDDDSPTPRGRGRHRRPRGHTPED